MCFRWYISSGQIDKAMEMLRKFERINGKKVDPVVYEEFEASCRKILENDKHANQYTVVDLFKLPRLARITVMLIIYWWVIAKSKKFCKLWAQTCDVLLTNVTFDATEKKSSFIRNKKRWLQAADHSGVRRSRVDHEAPPWRRIHVVLDSLVYRATGCNSPRVIPGSMGKTLDGLRIDDDVRCLLLYCTGNACW